MPIPLTVNNNTWNYPTPGDEPGWGEDATGFAEDVAFVLSNLQGADDIPETVANVANNVSSPANVVGLIFSPSSVRSAVIDYSVYRTTDSTELAEKGKMELVYKNGGTPGSKWTIGRVFFGEDSGLTFTMTDVGQIQYTSSNVAGADYSGEMRFQATVTQQ